MTLASLERALDAAIDARKAAKGSVERRRAMAVEDAADARLQAWIEMRKVVLARILARRDRYAVATDSPEHLADDIADAVDDERNAKEAA